MSKKITGYYRQLDRVVDIRTGDMLLPGEKGFPRSAKMRIEHSNDSDLRYELSGQIGRTQMSGWLYHSQIVSNTATLLSKWGRGDTSAKAFCNGQEMGLVYGSANGSSLVLYVWTKRFWQEF